MKNPSKKVTLELKDGGEPGVIDGVAQVSMKSLVVARYCTNLDSIHPPLSRHGAYQNFNLWVSITCSARNTRPAWTMRARSACTVPDITSSLRERRLPGLLRQLFRTVTPDSVRGLVDLQSVAQAPRMARLQLRSASHRTL